MRESVFNLLKNLRGLDGLRRLFIAELNYDRANQPISKRDWPFAASNSLTSDPTIIAEHGDFKIIYVQQGDVLSHMEQRVAINELLKSYPYALFVFSNTEQDSWHFVNVKQDYDRTKKQLLRRMTINFGQEHRTVSERLEVLDITSMSRNMFGVSPLTIQQRLDQAFDVEAVSRQFFKDYKDIFEYAEGLLLSQGLDLKETRLFIQKLFNRLMFIVFLERKGWLEFKNSNNYLKKLWKDYQNEKMVDTDLNFYLNRLYILFFSGFNNEINLIDGFDDKWIQSQIGNIPYLNGGLFENNNEDEFLSVHIDDNIFDKLINELLYRYNFTITESTPFDQEIAVDPEMLGKVFEELIIDRHEQGSYYTPKQIVMFMCRNSLKKYLINLLNENEEDIIDFIDNHNAFNLKNPEMVLKALQDVTVCDPACGSGAYLLGMLHELNELRSILFTSNKIDAVSLYQRKLSIIQKNIYGVDSDPIAVNIAQLRLWLSLVVDYEIGIEGDNPPKLPNLEYKIAVGNSLTSIDPSIGLQIDIFRSKQIENFFSLRDQYLRSYGIEKIRLREEISNTRKQINNWVHKEEYNDGFDWLVEFAEIFDDKGFDIVVANPPYVRHESIDLREKKIFSNIYPELYSGSADLFIYFYGRAIQILKPSGILAFISSNKWMNTGYGEKLRKLFSEEKTIDILVDFKDLPVFQAIAYPCIIIVSNNKPIDKHNIKVFTPVSLDSINNLQISFDKDFVNIPISQIDKNPWSFDSKDIQLRILEMKKNTVPLITYVNKKLYYGIKTGLNDAFIINEFTYQSLIEEDENSKYIIKPFLRGKDIKRWSVNYDNLYIIKISYGDTLKWLGKNTEGLSNHARRLLINQAEQDNSAWRIFLKKYEAIAKYLQIFEEKLKARQDKGDFWWELRSCEYYDEFEKPKIIFPDIAKEARFTIDTENRYIGNTGYIIPIEDYFLLGILNSKPVEEFYRSISAQVRGGYLRFIRQYVEKIPIPEANDSEKILIIELVKECIIRKNRQEEIYDLEYKINEIVLAMYNLSGGE